MLKLKSKLPDGPIQTAWTKHKNQLRLVGPKNRPKYKVIVVGSGLAGASAAASMGAMGYNVECFCFQDSPRRAHSIAAQGGINASRIIATMEIRPGACFTTPKKVATIGHANKMFTDWQN